MQSAPQAHPNHRAHQERFSGSSGSCVPA
jgi:hypothetical protein